METGVRKENIYSWMNQQIKAHKIQSKQLNLNDDGEIYCCVAGASGVFGYKEIHIYHIDELAKALDLECEVDDFNENNNRHYFWYKGYKFFGLEAK